MKTYKSVLFKFFALFILLFSTNVFAGDYRYDFDLVKLYNAHNSGVDTTQKIQDLQDRTTAYRELISQTGVIFAPSFLAPAETLGYSGFAIGANYGFTTIDKNADYWKDGIHGTPGAIVQTIGMEFRKGMWFPLPGFELGGGVKYLTQSHMYAPHVFAKFSINEGYFKWPVPAMAVRGHGIRVMGSKQVDLTIASIDVSFSKSIGLASSINITPYVGYNYLMIIGDSKVIDVTPGIDALNPDGTTTFGPGTTCTSSDCANNIVYDDQDVIQRHRFFTGVRFTYYKLIITLEGSWVMKGSSTDSVMDYSTNQDIKIKDTSSLQQSYYLLVGWDY